MTLQTSPTFQASATMGAQDAPSTMGAQDASSDQMTAPDATAQQTDAVVRSADAKSARGEPAYRQAAQMLERRILSGALAIGDSLPAEQSLAAELGVNRSTVREALRLLEENGLVRRRVGAKRMHVSAPEPEAVSQKMTTALVLGQTTPAELWGALDALEPAAAVAAADAITADQLAALEDNLLRTRRAVDDPERLIGLDLEFHALVAEASNNKAIQLCRAPLSGLFYPAFKEVIRRRDAGPRLLRAHEKIVAALRCRDPEEAGASMRRHLADFKRGHSLAGVDYDLPTRAFSDHAAAARRPAKRHAPEADVVTAIDPRTRPDRSSTA